MRKKMIITGASSGIGRAMAIEFAKRGYNLGLTARRTDRLQDLVNELKPQCPPDQQFAFVSLDVNSIAAVGETVRELIDSLGGLDVMVVNAGINQLTKVGRGELAEELQIVQTNLLGAMATVHAAVEYFRPLKQGHVVGISSLASLTPIPKQAAYCATKAGFSMYLDSAAVELRKQNIHFTKIMPGFVKTDIVDNMEQFPFLVSAEQAAQEIADHVEKRHAVGVVPAYPWKFLKPVLSNMPRGLWKYMKV